MAHEPAITLPLECVEDLLTLAKENSRTWAADSIALAEHEIKLVKEANMPWLIGSVRIADGAITSVTPEAAEDGEQS